MHALKPFEYSEPKTIQEATQLLYHHHPGARVLAGGIDLIPRMRKGSIRTEHVINIQKITALQTIQTDGAKGLRFGALTTLWALETSPFVSKYYPALHDAIYQISSIQAKHMGTVTGNLCVATPASDIATVLMALGAEVTIAGINGQRKESLERFYVDYGRTSLQQGEMVTEVSMVPPRPETGTAFLNLTRTHNDIAKVIVAVSIAAPKGVCRDVSIAVGAAGATVFRAKKAEDVLKDCTVDEESIRASAFAAAGETRPITDLRSTADYRKEMTEVLVKRALKKALTQVPA